MCLKKLGENVKVLGRKKLLLQSVMLLMELLGTTVISTEKLDSYSEEMYGSSKSG